MEGKGFLTDEAAYKNLQQYYNTNGAKLNILKMFKEDPDRFKKYRYAIPCLPDGTADRPLSPSPFMFMLCTPHKLYYHSLCLCVWG